MKTDKNEEKKGMKKRYKILIGLIFILISTILYGMFIGTSGLFVKEYKIVNKNIPDSFYGTKIIHISDIHYGRTVKDEELKRIVEEVNKLNPDIVIFTGDLIDRDTKVNDYMINSITTCLKEINAKLGKYAIYGNHDYVFKEYPNILQNSGFILLKNSYDIIYNESYDPIFLGGIDDNLEGKANIDEVMNYYKVEEPVEGSEVMEEKVLPKYKIILMHEPDYFNQFNDKYDIDLVLSGHSHNGQVRLPFIGGLKTVKGAKIYNKPYYKINKTDMYISSGIGTSKFNIRLFNRPSFNLYRLVNK